MLALLGLRKTELRLENGTVMLRLPRQSDHDEWAALRGESRGFLEPWEPTWARDELSAAAWRERLRRYRSDRDNGSALPLLIFDARTGRMAGGITLSNIHHGVAQSAAIGYWMGMRHAGRGLMPSALELVVRHGFGPMRLHRLEAACIPHNIRSVRVLEKTGFAREGLLRSYLKINGVWQDHLLYARISDQS